MLEFNHYSFIYFRRSATARMSVAAPVMLRMGCRIARSGACRRWWARARSRPQSRGTLSSSARDFTEAGGLRRCCQHGGRARLLQDAMNSHHAMRCDWSACIGSSTLHACYVCWRRTCFSIWLRRVRDCVWTVLGWDFDRPKVQVRFVSYLW